MRFPKAAFRFAQFGILASLLVMWACHVTGEEEKFLNIKADSSWTKYERIVVVLADSNGTSLDTLFDGHLDSPDQLKKLAAEKYDGGKIQIILIAMEDGKAVKRETRPFDGHTGEAGEKIVVIITPEPTDTSALDIRPDAVKLYTGGAGATLAPAGSKWDGVKLEWSSDHPEYASVDGGKVKAVAPGQAWIKAVSGAKRDSTDVTVATDAPSLDAGFDTVVVLGASVAFQVKVKQEYGTFAAFKWSLDNDTAWDDSSSDQPVDGRFTATAKTFSAEGETTLRFYVRDGEGNVVQAARKVTVSKTAPKDPPVIVSVMPGDTTISIKDSLAFTAKVTSTAALKVFTWDFDGDDKPDITGELSGTEATIKVGKRFNVDGKFTQTLKVADELGATAVKLLVVTVEKDPPSVDAGKDTVIAAGTKANLRGKVSDKFGSVVKVEWKIGAAAYAVLPAQTQITGSAEGGETIICLLKATDDDDQATVDTVRITVTGSADASLSGLAASAGPLAPAFNPDTLGYSVSTTETSTSVTATLPSGSTAAIKVNGTATASGTPSAPISLPAGATTKVTVLVTAEDGSPRTYSIDFTVPVPGKPDLAFTATAVTAMVPGRVDYSYTIKNQGAAAIPSLQYVSLQNYWSANTVFNDAGDVAAGGAILNVTKPLAAGETYSGTFYTLVAIPAGHPYLTFKIDWQDTVKESDEANNTAALQVLIAPDAKAGLDTTVLAGTAVNLHGKATDALGSVAKIEWKIGAGAYTVAKAETTFTAPGAAAVLNCILRVTDDDGLSDSDTVVVTVNGSPDADLSNLAPSTGVLSPAFGKNTTGYTLAVANTVTGMTFTPTVSSATATVKVNKVAVTSGSASGNIVLATGPNAVTVEVTAQSGMTKMYTVTVTRAQSTVNTLSNLTASIGAFTETFAPGTLSYSITTSAASTTVTPTVTAGSGATVKVNGVAVASGSASAVIALPAGQITTITVNVTPESGIVRGYEIKVTVPGTSKPDIQVVSSAWTSFTASRKDYTYTIKNVGGSTIEDIYSVTIQNYYSADNVYGNTGDSPAGGRIMGVRKSLAPGETYTDSHYTLTTPPAGANYLIWKIDSNDAVDESNETNNTYPLSLSP